jgi:hypothetical protein
MIHSRDGARVAIYCLWYGTNKVRDLFFSNYNEKNECFIDLGSKIINKKF